MTHNANTPLPASTLGVSQVDLEIPINAPPARAWRAIVEETTRWWSKDFYSTPPGRTPAGFIIEPRLGGRAYEDWGDGAGVVWYSVIGLDPPQLAHPPRPPHPRLRRPRDDHAHRDPDRVRGDNHPPPLRYRLRPYRP